LSPISPSHSPTLIDNLYLTCAYSTDSATSSAFLIYIYILEATADDIVNILPTQLDEMERNGALSSVDNHTSSMPVHPLIDTHQTTYLDDEHKRRP
jgi:hypothetical protein